MNHEHTLPETGFLRIWHIIGNKKTNIPALIPISRTSFLNGVKSGKYPKSVKLGERTTAWRVEDIRDLIYSINQA
jgi:predicted DNA-binding transcriptional regulator AlpA